jgi:WD40 repeat protein
VIRVSDQTGLAISVNNPSEVFSLAFSPQGNFLAAGYRDGSVEVWALPTGSQVYHLNTIGPDYQCYSCETPIQFSPDSTLLVTGSVDGMIRIWNASDGSPLAILNGHTGAVAALAFSADGVYLASGAQDGTVRIWGLTAK